MKNPFKKKDDPNRYLPVPREKYLSLGLKSPPENGFDDFLKLVWCRDTKDEKRQQKAQEKAKQEVNVVKQYFLCIVGIYEPYRSNDPPINLNKRGHTALPKWTDHDYLDEMLRNGYFFQNDEFILEHYPQAIRPAEDYPYVEQYVKAYQHWHNKQNEEEGKLAEDGGPAKPKTPTDDQKRAHKIKSAVIVLQTIDKLEADESGENSDETTQKMKDILESMDLDEELMKECKAKK